MDFQINDKARLLIDYLFFENENKNQRITIPRNDLVIVKDVTNNMCVVEWNGILKKSVSII